MSALPAFSLDNDAIKPSLEIGAFEALWATEVSSFKQLHDRVSQTNSGLLSDLISHDVAEIFYKKTMDCLHAAGISNFGVRIEGTLDYPQKLHDADYPLALFYYQGIWDLAFSRGVAVVGTRKPSAEGAQRAKKLVRQLVEAGFVIYSGLAEGIDTVAHETAIAHGGSTVAVIGTPLWLHYPKNNAALYTEIIKNHLLISQIPNVSYKEKSLNVTRSFFPERNKTMAALSEATIIVEAGETSGTLTQAKAALKQGRKVFILNNNFENARLTWPQQLQEAGAIRVFEISNILQELNRD